MNIPIITGPTATGKTALALRLAERYPIEIINADAYQVYSRMDIGTAKPSAEERAAVPHHLIDILEPADTYSAGDFVRHAEELIPQIQARGNTPVIVGGTGMYVESLANGMFEGPGRDDAFRAHMQEDIAAHGLAALYERLTTVDPEYAARISANDPTRIIRALEVHHLTGMSLTEAHKQLHRPPQFSYSICVLTTERQAMYDAIDARVSVMFDLGWEQEVASLLASGFSTDMPSFKAIGYREIADLLAGNCTREEVIADIQKKTRNFAKRQVTWFRHMKHALMLDIRQNPFSRLLSFFDK